MSQLPAVVGVIGGGRMGAGTAHVFAAAGAEVSVIESAEPAAARKRIGGSLAKAAERGHLRATLEDVLAHVTVFDDIAAMPSLAELIVEAVPERPDLKVDVLTRVEGR